ncbi:NAD-dependent epimerase/dehydratase family protein [Jiella sp. MQZ9-1]|uniref:NAD-dependent epimerase/dehydratase family protein n=1 Tax=Jiella flava TaxID=2816857 RepID=A0A939FT09_9HYPH|nr:NAD-dependent epimerase/dehydratase family protein [Jiella flava]MBO0661388.1 NAD-dependent epimerase/dehydratase family protein [Jiella flava]MCD2470032.1 NAD-dependent epimerase/dehydratase family protein [Jiella flava]
MILVTGGAGFIGSHLVPQLVARGHYVRVLDVLSAQIHGMLPSPSLDWLTQTQNVDFRRGSVTSEADLRAALDGVTSVIHLAAETGTGQSMYEIDRYCRENVQGTARLMHLLANGAATTVRRVLLASSRSVYGEGAYVDSDAAETERATRITPASRSAEALRARKWEPTCPETGKALTAVPTREDDRTAPASIYAATKLMQEDLVRIGCDSAGLGHAILRLQNVYGEGQSLNNPYTGILSIFSTRIRRGLELPIFEDGLESRDFVHVSDVAAAFAAAAEAEAAPNTVINVGSGRATSVIDIAKALCRAFNEPENLTVTGQFRLGDIRHNVADVGRLRDRLGLTPQVGLDEGLRRFAQWVSTQPLPEDRLGEANAELAKRKMMG